MFTLQIPNKGEDEWIKSEMIEGQKFVFFSFINSSTLVMNAKRWMRRKRWKRAEEEVTAGDGRARSKILSVILSSSLSHTHTFFHSLSMSPSHI